MILQRIVVGMVLIFVFMNASRGESYTLNPGDILSISVWNEEALQQSAKLT